MPRQVKGKKLADAIVHPVRLEILRAFEMNGPQTIGELAKALPRLPRPSLYRHVAVLHEVGAVEAQDVRQGSRGAPERVYAATDTKSLTIAIKGKERTPAALRRYHLAILAAQAAMFEKALARGPLSEKYTRSTVRVVNVNEAELAELRAMLARIDELAENPAKGRVSLSFGYMMFPEKP
jgi:predicted ArsR family transcriptional regulator